MRVQIRNGRAVIDHDDPALRLTAPQRSALELGREIMVTAGAGAGKTHVLAMRYVTLFLEIAHVRRPEIDAVAVLTFTEKAAEEMAERCYTRLTALGAAIRAARPELDELAGPDGLPLGAHLTAAVDHLCDRFDSARIGTFHGFCSSILREFPVETTTPLDTVLIEPSEAAALRTELLEQTLLARVRSDPEAFGQLLDAFGSRARLLHAATVAFDRREDLSDALEEHASGSHTIETRIAGAHLTPKQARAWLEGSALPNLRALRQLAGPGGPSAFIVEQIDPVLRRLEQALPDDPSERALELFGRVRVAQESLLNDKGALRTLGHPSVLGARSSWLDPNRYTKAKRALGVLEQRCAGWPALARRARELPTRADHALLGALRVLSSWVLEAVHRYQDVLVERRAVDFSEMQRRAVHAVLEHALVRETLTARHRYLVVDEFQDTDPRQWALIRAIGRPDHTPSDRIFLVGDVKQAIYGFRGGDVTVFDAAREELGVDPVELPDNFRSRPALIEWFNATFPDVLEPTPVLPMRSGRTEAGGTVSIVLGKSSDEQRDPDAVAHLIAAEMLAGQHPWAELELWNRERHPAPPIAVLLRRRTHLGAYEEALRARGIPYAVARGVGFWSRPEVVDLVNALHALATGDPISVAGTLRSPLFGLTDQDLADLGPDGLTRFGATPGPGVERWRNLQALSREVAVSQLVRAMVDQSRPLYRPSATKRGRQEANGDRLVDLAAPFDARGGLRRCARAFLDCVLTGERTSEAVLSPDRARVLLLTIHAAKGLEFPVVLVPEIDVPPRPETAPLSLGRPGGSWELAFAVADETSGVQRQARPGILEAVQRAARADADAEYRRLLYVAATRARDHLVLLGNEPRDTPARESWVERLFRALPATTRIRSRADVTSLPLEPSPAVYDLPAVSAPIRLARAQRRVELGPSGLDQFEACPARWYRRHVLGLPEHARRTEERARILAGLRGQVIHGLLEDRCSDDQALAQKRWRAAVLDAGLSLEDAREGAPRLLEHLHTLTQSNDLAYALDAPGHSELPFRIPLGDVVLKGQIDRLYISPDGWVVLDYKTEAVRGAILRQAQGHRRQLLAYVWAADRILRNHGQPPVVRGELLFTATGQLVPMEWSDEDRLGMESLLAEVGRVARLDWSAVERLSLQPGQPRPCEACGFRGKGCRGS